MSKYFEKVKSFYNANLWSESLVRNAVDRWVSADEFLKITGTEYENKKE